MINGAKKVGIMGGTFDPIHYGHLMIAENAAQQFNLDYVLFIPAGNPPHKKKKQITDADIRYEMVKIAIKDNPHFLISKMEIERKTYSYTYLTIQELKQKYPQTEFYFIMGADSLFDFEQWVEPQSIADSAVIVVAVRDFFDHEILNSKIDQLERLFQADIKILNTPNFSIASHDIRDRIENHVSARYQLPDQVLEFIFKNELYSSNK